MLLRRRVTEGCASTTGGRASLAYAVVLVVILAWSLVWVAACNSGGNANESTSSTTEQGTKSGDVEGTVGTELHIGAAGILVKALQATFQPAVPTQRLLEETPPAPAEGQSFYQAYVRVSNGSQVPLRIDPDDFACAVGDVVVAIDRTRSGPLPRSILKNTSLDLVLTFQAPVGYQPLLIYHPPWYQGVISIKPQEETTTT